VKTILLVNESRVTLELIKVFLVDKNVRVLDVQDGVEALAVAKVEQPDLILCDQRLPRLDGPGLCRALRADLKLRHIPVIILTSDRDGGAQRLCREAGARDVLQKPIGPRALQDAVRLHTGISFGMTYPVPPTFDRAG